MGNLKTYIIREIVKYSHKLDQKGFGANHDGNISAKFEDVLLATPTAVSKGNMVADMVIMLDMEGKKREGIGKPFSEIKLHLAAYRARSDAKAVVHAHPPFSTARGLVGLPLESFLPEAVVSIGHLIPVVDFAMPGDSKNDQIIHDALQICDVFMMPGNGVLAIGDDIEQAYLRIELVEHLAKIQSYAENMGSPKTLMDQADIEKLLAKRKAGGLGPAARLGNDESVVTAPKDDAMADLKAIIAAEIKKIM